MRVWRIGACGRLFADIEASASKQCGGADKQRARDETSLRTHHHKETAREQGTERAAEAANAL